MSTGQQDLVSVDYVYGLALSPAFEQDGICFAAKRSGLFRSDDGGESWSACFTATDEHSAPTAATALVLSPAFETDQTLYAASRGAVMCSMDGGQHWQYAGLPFATSIVSALGISPNFEQDGIVLAATLEDGVLRSVNRGEGWVAWNFGLLDWHVQCMAVSPDFAQDETVYIGCDSGLFISHTGGRAWRNLPLPDESAPVSSVSSSPQGPASLWVGTEAGRLFGYQGNAFTELRLPAELQGERIHSITAQGETLIVGLQTQLLVRDTQGQHWQRSESTPDEYSEITSVALTSDGQAGLMGCLSGQIHRISLDAMQGCAASA